MWRRRWVSLGVLVGLIGGCSSGGTVLESKVGPGSGGGAGGEGGSGGMLFGGGSSGGGASGMGSGGVCASNAFIAERLPVDMYIMFDQSMSMSEALPDNSGSWWTAAQAAVTSFVSDTMAKGMGVGLQYFGLNRSTPGCTAFDPVSGDCCNSAVYQTPEIEIGLLPANAGALVASIQAHAPSSFTPTTPALQGAIDHMKAWGRNHVGRAPVVVLVTDGFPTTCADTTPTGVSTGMQASDVAVLAKTAFETDPPVRTFVVGFNSGQGLENLDQIAKAGGTSQAFLIAGGNIGDTFVNAMLSIASTQLQCSFDLPKPTDPNGTIDKDKVDVSYTPSATGITEPVAKLNNFSDCSVNQNQGWYYDSPGAPTKIEICPGTCARFAAGTVKLLSGCAPVINLTR
jgi:hypothetical protein